MIECVEVFFFVFLSYFTQQPKRCKKWHYCEDILDDTFEKNRTYWFEAAAACFARCPVTQSLFLPLSSSSLLCLSSTERKISWSFGENPELPLTRYKNTWYQEQNSFFCIAGRGSKECFVSSCKWMLPEDFYFNIADAETLVFFNKAQKNS